MKPEPNPTAQPCKTCKFFSLRPTHNLGRGFCASIEDAVEAWWTGCVRHKTRDTLEKERDIARVACGDATLDRHTMERLTQELAVAVQERDIARAEARRLKLKIQHAFNNGYVLKPERDEDPEPTRDDSPPYRSPRCGVCYWALYDGEMCQNQSCTERGKYIGENRVSLSNQEAAVLIEWRKTK